VREDRPGDARIVAYVVPKPGRRADTPRLLAHVRRTLPDYMVPQHFVALEQVPLLPNGKIDRKALPDPMVDTEAQAPRVAPQGTLEALIAGHMAQVLGVPAVGADEDFFDIGGHSLLAVQLFHRLRRDTGVNLPLAVLFSAPSVQGLAVAYRSAGARDGDGGATAAKPVDPWAPLVPIRAGQATPALFLVHAVGGNVLNYRPLAACMPEGVPVYGLQAVGLDGGTEPLSRIEDMAARYVDEVRSVQPRGPYMLAGGSMGGMIAYEMARQLASAGDEVALLGLIDTSAMFRQVHRQLARGEVPLLDRLRGRFAGLGVADSARLAGEIVVARSRRLWNALRASLARRVGAELPHDVRYAMIESAHMAAYRQYVIKPYPGRVTLFRAEVQPACHGDEPTLGWSAHAAAVDVTPIPGSHAGLVEAPELGFELAEAVRLSVDAAAGAPAPAAARRLVAAA
jgi:thioesterase domain-containing protein